MESPTVQEGDFVLLNGGGTKRITEVKKNVFLRMGRSGTATAESLAGLRFGEVVHLDHGTKKFVACDDYPDLDVSGVGEAGSLEENNDNRNLVDDNQSQQLSNEEVAAIRKEKGIGGLLDQLVENSATFHSKTVFSKEKYLRKKTKKYGTLFKVERVTPDNMAEVHFPTINPSDSQPEESRYMRLRADTVALILHHSDVHDGSRVIVYDRTNGTLPAYLLTRLGASGHLFQILDKSAQPNAFPCKQLGLTNFKDRWHAVPRNPGFLEGVEDPVKEAPADGGESEPSARARHTAGSGPSQWLKGIDARAQLLALPADSLIIADDERPERALADLLPFLTYGGHVVVYSPFLEDLTALFLKLRNDCINIRISETWYRHQQVLPQRTHPTVNMSTAAGYLLTAIKVQPNPSPRPRFANLPALSPSEAIGYKRPRDGECEKDAAKEADQQD